MEGEQRTNTIVVEVSVILVLTMYKVEIQRKQELIKFNKL